MAFSYSIDSLKTISLHYHTSFLYILISASRGAMTDSIGGESSSFWFAWTLLRVASAAYCAANASFFSFVIFLISRFCNESGLNKSHFSPTDHDSLHLTLWNFRRNLAYLALYKIFHDTKFFFQFTNSIPELEKPGNLRSVSSIKLNKKSLKLVISCLTRFQLNLWWKHNRRSCNGIITFYKTLSKWHKLQSLTQYNIKGHFITDVCALNTAW